MLQKKNLMYTILCFQGGGAEPGRGPIGHVSCQHDNEPVLKQTDLREALTSDYFRPGSVMDDRPGSALSNFGGLVRSVEKPLSSQP